MISAGFKLPAKNILVSIGPSQQKLEMLPYLRILTDLGYQLYVTKGTGEFIKEQGNLDSVITLYKPHVKREPNVMSLLKTGKLDLVINVPDSMDSQALSDGFDMRRAAVDSGTPLVVDIKCAMLLVMSLHRKWQRERAGRAFWSFQSWQEYVEPRDILARALAGNA